MHKWWKRIPRRWRGFIMFWLGVALAIPACFLPMPWKWVLGIPAVLIIGFGKKWMDDYAFFKSTE